MSDPPSGGPAPPPPPPHAQAQPYPWAPRPRMGVGTVAGIVVVSTWMAVSLLFSAFIVSFGADATCNSAPDQSACLDRVAVLWLVLMGIELAAVVGTIILWVRPRTRVWGFLLGILGTGVLALLFSAVMGIDL
jgi:hypothetical protein